MDFLKKAKDGVIHALQKAKDTINGVSDISFDDKDMSLSSLPRGSEEPDMPEGLTLEEVKEQTALGNTNEVKDNAGRGYLKIITDNLFTFFNLIWAIVTVALISFNSFENLTFLIVVGTNLLVAIVQEIRAKIAVGKLSVTTQPKALVVREGELMEVPSEQIVLGDVMKIGIGKQILSDSVVISGVCEVNESMLTGESNAIKKESGDKLLAGTYLVSGSIYARVTGVGSDNYIHKLEKEAKKFKAPSSNLFRDLNKLIKSIGGIIIPIAILTIIFNWLSYKDSYEGFELAKTVVVKTCGSVVGMIPSGMYLLVTLTLSLSVMTLARKKTLVQDMYSIEMLASADLVCLDKTGTITDGTMQVSDVYPLSSMSSAEIARTMAFINHASNGVNATSNALLRKFGKEKCTILDSIPFSSSRKYSACTIDGVGSFAIGAPHFVPCEVTSLVESRIEEFARDGKRVLLLARLDRSGVGIPCALIAIEDRIRPNARETIEKFQSQGVVIKVISGDHAATVSAIAKKVGINNSEKYISCENLTDEELIAIAEDFTVFGRVTPEQKVLLVKTFKVYGHTVAMTGDGVNDTLALKESNCAIAMADGSEVARQVAQIVLINSDFGTLPDVVREGRRCINNVRQSGVLYLMKTIFTIFISVFCIITMTGYPFAPNNFLFLEMFIIGLGSVLLALEPNNDIIKGSFLDAVLIKSLPCAVSLLVPTIAGMIIGIFGASIISPAARNSVAMCVVILVGYLNLIFICRPYTKWRAAVVGLVGFLLAGAITVSSVVDGLNYAFGFHHVVKNPVYFAFMLVLGGVTTVLMHYFREKLEKWFGRVSKSIKLVTEEMADVSKGEPNNEK